MPRHALIIAVFLVVVHLADGQPAVRHAPLLRPVQVLDNTVAVRIKFNQDPEPHAAARAATARAPGGSGGGWLAWCNGNRGVAGDNHRHVWILPQPAVPLDQGVAGGREPR